ncbi:MAG: hypothetical protein HC812_11955 [Leptolyngbya sp. RL_3_1]|nr:hypothetical protein [Leptolyngbya sp. RL_3_1]
MKLRDEKWDRDLAELIDVLEADHGFVDHQASITLPQPIINIPALTAVELESALSSLSGWLPVESTVPRDYPKTTIKNYGRFTGLNHSSQLLNSCMPQYPRSIN